MKLYRGFNNNYPNLGVRPEQKGIWMTEDEEYAKEYADMFKNGAIAEIELDDYYISLASENDYFEIFGDDFDELGGDVEWDNEVCGILKEKGYDGFVFDDYGVYCYYIFNRDLIKGYKIIKTFKNNREDAMESLYEGLANKPVSFTAYHGGVEPDMTPDEGRAFYLTDDYNLALQFARREVYDDGLYVGEIPTVFTFKGTFNNPYYLTDDEYDSEGQDSNIDYEKWVKMGVDGLVYKGHTTYYIVIDLSTIKLVDKKVFEDEAILDESVILKEDIAAVQKYFPKIHPSDFNNLINYDPTYKGGNELGKYGKWILSLYNNYIKDDIAHKKWEDQKNQGNNYPEPIRKSSEKLEDFEKLPDLLRQYDVINNKVKNDISNIKSISDLYSFVNTHKSQGISDNSKVNHAKDLVKKSVKNGGEIVFQDNNWIVLIPKTLKSSVVFGEDTNWCTTSPNGDMYNEYKDRYGGEYFINVNLTTGDLYQFHFESNQYMDSTDKEINIVDFLNNNQNLFNFYKNYFKNSLVSKSEIGILFVENPTEEEQLKAVRHNGLAIKYIKNPSEKVQIEAIINKSSSFKYIKNPSEKIQIEAVKQNGMVIRYIKNPSEEMQLAVVDDDVDNIMWIKNPTEKVQMKAVKESGWLIRYIKNPSEQVQMEAVKENGYAIGYIENPTEKVQLEAVRKDGQRIIDIKNPSERVQIEAVKNKPWAIEYIKNPSERVQIEAVMSYDWDYNEIENFIKNFIKNPTPKVKEYVEKMKNVKESKIPSLRVDEKKFKSSIFNVLLESNILTEDIAAVKKYFPKVPEEKIQTLIELDPTYQGGDNLGKFGKWILGLYNKGQLKDEDFYKVPQYLTTFKDNLKKIQNKDIMSYKTLPDLAQAIQPYEGQKDVSKKQQVKQLKSDEAEKILETSNWLIVHPKTHKADCYYGANTKWCTASKDSDNWFNDYNEKGPLFVLINKKNGKKYQFHFETLSFMNELDSPVSPSEVIGGDQEATQWFIDYCQDHLPVIIENYNEDAYNEIYDNGSYSVSMSVERAIDNVMYTNEKTLFDTDELASWYDDSKTAFEFWNGTIRNYLKDNPEFHEECEEAVVDYTDENAFISDIHNFLKENDLYANKEFQWQLYRNLGDLFDKIYGSKIEELWQDEYGNYDVDGGSFYLDINENDIINEIFDRGELDADNLIPSAEGSYDYYDLDKDFQKAMEKTIIQTIKDWTKSENQLEFKFDESVKNWKNPFLED